MSEPGQSEKRRRGRPATYASAADRARAWRVRQKELIAAAQSQREPIIVEKIVEVERLIEKPQRSTPQRKSDQPLPDATKLLPSLRKVFTGYQSEENAKRFRVNAAKASSTARDLLAVLSSESVPEAEREFLVQSAAFFDSLSRQLQFTQADAKKAKEKAEKEYQAKHERAVSETIRELFGSSLQADAVFCMAESLLEFNGVADQWLAKRYDVDRGYISIQRDYELRGALKSRDLEKTARELAEVKMDIGIRGRRWTDREETGWAAGWSDFEEFRTTGLLPKDASPQVEHSQVSVLPTRKRRAKRSVATH